MNPPDLDTARKLADDFIATATCDADFIMVAMMRSLIAEVARLRAALAEIAANSVEDEWERFGDPHASMLDAVRIARAALGEGT